MEDGKIVGLIAAITNITTLKRTEAALRESEATFRAMFDASSVGKIEVEPGSSRFLRANAAMCKSLGYSEEELLARTLLEITHPEDRDRSRELGLRLDTGESDVFDIEKRYIRKNGNAVWASSATHLAGHCVTRLSSRISMRASRRSRPCRRAKIVCS